MEFGDICEVASDGGWLWVGALREVLVVSIAWSLLLSSCFCFVWFCASEP